MATGDSYFSGSTIMPSQGQHAGTAPDNSAIAFTAPSPAKSRDTRFAGCTPTTVRHLARSFAAAAAAVAAAGGGDPVITIDGVEVTNVRVVGRVVSVVNTETGVSFTLDDGTGKIALMRWLTDQTDALEAAFVQNGVYLKVQVTLVGFQAKQQGRARSIRPVINFNEVALHFIECMHVHLENVRPKMQALPSHPVQANTSFHEMQVQLPHTVQTNAPAHVSFSGGVRDHQVHLAQVNQGQFPMSVHPNASTHVPFSGRMREQHNNFTPQSNQFSAYPGTGGQEHDLQGMILEVMHQPDILALENGVHADQLARRLGVPKAQIMETARCLEDKAYLFSTIDEFHFRSTLNG